MRPVTAIRGRRSDPSPKSRTSAIIQNARGLDDKLLAERLRNLRQGDVNGEGHDPKLVGGQQHHRAPGAVAHQAARQIGQEFGVARMSEAGFVEHALGNGVRHHCRCFAADNSCDRLLDRADHRGCVGGIRAARLDRALKGNSDDGQVLRP